MKDGKADLLDFVQKVNFLDVKRKVNCLVLDKDKVNVLNYVMVKILDYPKVNFQRCRRFKEKRKILTGKDNGGLKIEKDDGLFKIEGKV